MTTPGPVSSPVSSPVPNPYPATSRHHGLPTASYLLPDGRTITYLERRLVSEPDRLFTRGTAEVHDGERLDQLAATHLGDPAAWWLLVEAEVVEHPADLLAEPGRRVRIALPPQFTGDVQGGGA